MPEQRRPFARMESGSAFGDILERFVRNTPGCYAAVFVDPEGEAVDAVGWAEAFDVLVAGAHFRIVLADAAVMPGGSIRELIVTAVHCSYRLMCLPEGYALVLLFRRDCAFSVSRRALLACAHELSSEAGFSLSQSEPIWHAVEVLPSGDITHRPRRARGRGDWNDVEVLGTIVGLSARERGFRVRLGNGAEMTLLREPLGHWWADERLE